MIATVIPQLLKSELAKLAVSQLSRLDAKDLKSAVRSLSRASRRFPFLPSLGGFGLGLAVGAAVGVLLAPRSGVETRSAIRNVVRERVQSWRAGEATDSVPAAEGATLHS
jgi:hypothetical protein